MYIMAQILWKESHLPCSADKAAVLRFSAAFCFPMPPSCVGDGYASPPFSQSCAFPNLFYCSEAAALPGFSWRVSYPAPFPLLSSGMCRAGQLNTMVGINSQYGAGIQKCWSSLLGDADVTDASSQHSLACDNLSALLLR